LVLPNLVFTVPLAKFFARDQEIYSESHLEECFNKLTTLENINDLIEMPAETILFVGAILYPDLLVAMINKNYKNQMSMNIKRSDSKGW
jgi:hypothetical protein